MFWKQLSAYVYTLGMEFVISIRTNTPQISVRLRSGQVAGESSTVVSGSKLLVSFGSVGRRRVSPENENVISIECVGGGNYEVLENLWADLIKPSVKINEWHAMIPQNIRNYSHINPMILVECSAQG